MFSSILKTPIKWLFLALKNDDIGFSHTLLHSCFIENFYQYGAGSPHKQVILELLKFSNLAIDPSKVGSSLVYLLQNKDDKEVITEVIGIKMVGISTQTREIFMPDAVRIFVNNQEYHDLAKKIIDSSALMIRDDSWCFYLWRALEHEYKEMAFIIVQRKKKE